ncbi:MAG: hypothetical protein ABIG63_10715 [Chloroflexota bacterium]
MSDIKSADFGALYAQFQAPISVLDCGEKCAPYNEYGAPFCCDTAHAIPTAYQPEWDYLQQSSTDLWHLWDADDPATTARLRAEISDGQVLIECRGLAYCQRSFRSITCRAFPFFPYITRQGEFIGLAYYWQYEDRCWMISNLHTVTLEYRAQFIAVYDYIFEHIPQEVVNFRYYSTLMRRVFGRRKRSIPVLHRNGNVYKITPRNGRMRRVSAESLSKFGLYKIAAMMPFPDEA